MDRVGLEDMLSGASQYLADWWWLLALAFAGAILRQVAFGKRSRRYRRSRGNSSTGARRRQRRAVSPGFVARSRPARRVEIPTRTISGKAYVTDGDGVRVAGQEVRLAGLDAPEWDQKAKDRNGRWFNHGRYVKSALIRKIGGKHIRVAIEGEDKFGRLLGTVTCNGGDVGEWLVREGHAIAAYDGRYKHVEREARKAKRGMWGHAHNFDPRAHRKRKPERSPTTR